MGIFKAKRTKELQRGFLVYTTLDLDQLWEVADRVCKDTPEKKGLVFTRGAMVFYPRLKAWKERTIGYGTLTVINKETGDKALSPEWALRFHEAGTHGDGRRAFRLAFWRHKVVNGRIDQVGPLEDWLIRFSAELKARDETAAVASLSSRS